MRAKLRREKLGEFARKFDARVASLASAGAPLVPPVEVPPMSQPQSDAISGVFDSTVGTSAGAPDFMTAAEFASLLSAAGLVDADADADAVEVTFCRCVGGKPRGDADFASFVTALAAMAGERRLTFFQVAAPVVDAAMRARAARMKEKEDTSKKPATTTATATAAEPAAEPEPAAEHEPDAAAAAPEPEAVEKAEPEAVEKAERGGGGARARGVGEARAGGGGADVGGFADGGGTRGLGARVQIPRRVRIRRRRRRRARLIRARQAPGPGGRRRRPRRRRARGERQDRGPVGLGRAGPGRVHRGGLRGAGAQAKRLRAERQAGSRAARVRFDDAHPFAAKFPEPRRRERRDRRGLVPRAARARGFIARRRGGERVSSRRVVGGSRAPAFAWCSRGPRRGTPVTDGGCRTGSSSGRCR